MINVTFLPIMNGVFENELLSGNIDYAARMHARGLVCARLVFLDVCCGLMRVCNQRKSRRPTLFVILAVIYTRPKHTQHNLSPSLVGDNCIAMHILH